MIGIKKPVAKLVVMLVGGAALAGLQSCVAVAAGAAGGATVAYVMGEYASELDGTPKQVVEAAKDVLKDMDMKIQTSASSAMDGKVVAKSALDKTITIIVKRVTDERSKINIRVGTFGDEEVSRSICEKIKKEL